MHFWKPGKCVPELMLPCGSTYLSILKTESPLGETNTDLVSVFKYLSASEASSNKYLTPHQTRPFFEWRSAEKFGGGVTTHLFTSGDQENYRGYQRKTQTIGKSINRI